MKKIYHHHTINFKVPQELALRASEAAQDLGMTRSDFIRQAIIRNLEVYSLYERDLLSRAHAFRSGAVSP